MRSGAAVPTAACSSSTRVRGRPPGAAAIRRVRRFASSTCAPRSPIRGAGRSPGPCAVAIHPAIGPPEHAAGRSRGTPSRPMTSSIVGSMNADELRAEFPVTERLAFLNAGSSGPMPRRAATAAAATLELAVHGGRARDHFEQLTAASDALRGAYAALLSASPEDIALTTATSEGIVRVTLGLDLTEGDEVLIAEGEHPGLLGPLGALRRHAGITVRAVPADQLAAAIAPATRLIACSHVGWTSGALAPDLSAVDVPVLLDGAQ